MVWFDDSGRMRLCEAGISGYFAPPMRPCFSTCSGYVVSSK